MAPLIAGSVPRKRLLDLIDEPGLAPITLITAPAGYGKSTLVHQWAANHAPQGCGWYQSRVEHNSLSTFLHHIWQAIDEATGNPEPPPDEITIDSVLQRLGDLSDPIVLVVDDYHLIESELIHQLVETLLRNLPDSTRIVILSRQIPTISLARLRAHGRVRQITQEDLAFTFEEVKCVFAHQALDDELLRRLNERTEGWIAGLQLTLMAVDLDSHQPSTSIEQVIASMPSNRLLSDYIVEEVLNALPDDLRRFVLDTSVLSSLEPAICDAVLHIDSSETLLERLEDHVVFVARPGGIGTPLIYHRLFAESVQRLRRQFPSSLSTNELHLRAAQWHRERGELEHAADYALAAEAWAVAADLIREFLPAMLACVDPWDAYDWFRRLPEEFFVDDPDLYRCYLIVLLLSGQFEQARPLVEAGFRAPEYGRDTFDEGWQANLRALLAQADGDWGEALHQSYCALSLLPPTLADGRLLAWAGIIREEFARGNREVARAALHQAEIARQRRPNEALCWHSLLAPDIANDTAIRGDLFGAEALTRHFLDELPPYANTSAGRLATGLLALYLEQNRLDLAAIAANDVLGNLHEHAYRVWSADALSVLARYYLACNEPDSARDMLDRALELTRRHGGYALIRKTEASIANYWLQTGQHQLAHLWAVRTELEPDLARTFGEVEPHTVRIELLLRREQPLEAKALIAQSLIKARQEGNVAAAITFLVWSSVVARALGELDEANEALRQALELGAPGRFRRVYERAYLDLGNAIRALLPALSEGARRHAISMVGDPAVTGEAAEASPWTEAGLTRREREVLSELVLGKSNREISRALYISERTVKKHLTNLFRKTGASNRIAVALWGRERMPGTPSPLGQLALRQPAELYRLPILVPTR